MAVRFSGMVVGVQAAPMSHDSLPFLKAPLHKRVVADTANNSIMY